MASSHRALNPRLSSNWHKSSKRIAASAAPLRSSRSVSSAPMATFYAPTVVAVSPSHQRMAPTSPARIGGLEERNQRGLAAKCCWTFEQILSDGLSIKHQLQFAVT